MPGTFRTRLVLLLALGLAALGAGVALHSGGSEVAAQAQEPKAKADTLEQQFSAKVQPFFERYFFSCHGPKKQEAELNLSRDLNVAAMAKNTRQWELVRARLQAQEMPPEDAARRPGAEERSAVIA